MAARALVRPKAGPLWQRSIDALDEFDRGSSTNGHG